MGKRKTNGLADKIYQKTNLSMVAYAENRGLSLKSLKQGYISIKTANALNRDGIIVKPTTKKAKK